MFNIFSPSMYKAFPFAMEWADKAVRAPVRFQIIRHKATQRAPTSLSRKGQPDISQPRSGWSMGKCRSRPERTPEIARVSWAWSFLRPFGTRPSVCHPQTLRVWLISLAPAEQTPVVARAKCVFNIFSPSMYKAFPFAMEWADKAVRAPVRFQIIRHKATQRAPTGLSRKGQPAKALCVLKGRRKSLVSHGRGLSSVPAGRDLPSAIPRHCVSG